MIYLTSYLVIGLLYCLGALIYSYFFDKKHATSFEKSIVNFTLGLIIGALVWPFVLYSHLSSYLNPPFEPEKFSIKEKDLIESMSVKDVEKKEVIHDPLNAVPQEPFGHLHNKWQEFKTNHAPLVLWSFKSEYEDYSGALVKEGYAIIEEDGSIKAFFVHQDYRQ